VLGGVYFLVAVKRVRGSGLAPLILDQADQAHAAPAVVANRQREPAELHAEMEN
jgi:hypothetical protein